MELLGLNKFSLDKFHMMSNMHANRHSRGLDLGNNLAQLIIKVKNDYSFYLGS